MREPPITLTCDCGVATHVRYGERWTCPTCGKTWDTSQIPAAEYDQLRRSVRLYSLLSIGPPLAFAIVLIPLAVLHGLQFALMLIVLVMMHALLVMPKIRERATASAMESTRSWKLRPEQ
jgi:hypothetical protein